MFDLTPTQLSLLLLVGIVAHIAIPLTARRLNIMFVLTALFCVLAPLAAAPEFPYFIAVKYARVYVTLLLFLVGALFLRLLQPRGASLAFVLFAILYMLAGMWSDLPLAAVKYKGLYVLSVMSGLMIAMSVRSMRDLEVGMRVLLLAGIAFAGIIVFEMARSPTALSQIGRLSVLGMNPNRIGQVGAPLLLVSVFVALYDTAKFPRVVAYTTGAVLAGLILYTGSRGALGEAVIGVFLIAVPLLKRPGLLAVLAVVVFVSVEVGSNFVQLQDDTADRLTEVNFDTRWGVWAGGLDMWSEKPVFGHGWVYHGDIKGSGRAASRNMHSIYMQVLTEMGVMGISMMLLMLMAIGYRSLRMWRFVTTSLPRCRHTAYLGLAITAAVFAHGVIESGTMMGATLNALFLAFGIGLIDRMPALAHAEEVAYQDYLDELDELDELAEIEQERLEAEADDPAFGGQLA